MRNYFSKIALTATLGLVASILSCAPSAGRRYASEQGCRWNYELQHGWLADEEHAKMVRNNAATETLANPNCAEVLREAARMNYNRKEERGNHNDTKNYLNPGMVNLGMVKLGMAYFRKGDYDKAIEDFSQAIRLKPDYADAYAWRGMAYFRKGDYDEAIEDFSQAIKLKPDFETAKEALEKTWIAKMAR